MSRVDATVTDVSYEIVIDPKTYLPQTMRVAILTGIRGKTKKGDSLDSDEEHIAFHLSYSFDEYGKLKPLEIPKGARKLLL